MLTTVLEIPDRYATPPPLPSARMGNTLTIRRRNPAGDYVSVGATEPIRPRETLRLRYEGAGGIVLWQGTVTFRVFDAASEQLIVMKTGFGVLDATAVVDFTAPAPPGTYTVEARVADPYIPFRHITDRTTFLIQEGAPPASESPGPTPGLGDFLPDVGGGIEDIVGGLGTVAKVGLLLVGGVLALQLLKTVGPVTSRK